MIVLAALDNSLAADPVAHIACWLAAHLDDEVDALAIEEDGVEVARAAADRCGVALRVVPGTPAVVLPHELNSPEVAMVVMGCRGVPSGPRPAGHLALDLLLHARKPIVIVPPDCAPTSELSDRVLVPLDGAETTARAVDPMVSTLRGAGFDVVALHVFDERSVPSFWDRPEHAADDWQPEFVARNVPEAASVHVRSGAPGAAVLELAEAEAAGMVVLAWAQDLSSGRAQTVLDVLCHARVPVLLVPVDT